MHSANSVLQAIQAGDAAALRALLEAEPELAAAHDEQGLSAVAMAVYRGRRDLADALVTAGAPLSLFEAAMLGRLDLVDRATRAGPGAASAVSADGFTPLHLACFFGQPAAVALLLRRGGDVGAVARNPSRVQPLHSAAAGKSVAIVALLLGAGANPDAAQQNDFTALHAAAHHGDADMARLLLAYAADPALRTADGKSARDIATERGHRAVLAVLDE